MSRREFTKVSPNIWRSRRFVGQADEAKVLYLFLLTCEHQNSTGCFRLPDGYACTDLHWPVEKYQGARDALVAAELVAFDPDTSLIYVRRWFKHSPPMNDKHAAGTIRLISEIDSDFIREIVEGEFTAANQGRAIARPDSRMAPGASRMTGGIR